MNIYILNLCFCANIFAQSFMVSLDYPSLVDNNLTNIISIGTDSQKNFIFSLENSQARRYDSTLTSYTNFTLP